jgi:hypothetical protein
MRSFPRILILLSFQASFAAMHEPFPIGYSMANNGTIMHTSGISGQQPWIPACFLIDSSGYGLSVCGIDYYDQTDDPGGRIGQVALGGWYAHGRFVVKTSCAYYNAMDLYSEQQGYCSIGVWPVRCINASIDITGFRAGILHENQPNAALLDAGIALFGHGKNTAVSFSCIHLPLYHGMARGIELPMTLTGGIYAAFINYGAQGIVCEMMHETDWLVRFSIGEEYCWNDYFSICGAITTNPFMLSFGCSITWGRSGATVALVNHPILGWSKGLTLNYASR